MAYPNYYPQFYQPMYPPIYQPQIPTMNQQQVQPQTTQKTDAVQPQITNGGFVLAPSEDVARAYPIAPGNCVTFKIEGKPIVIEKSMGFSQLEAPKVEKYRLVKEEDTPQTSIQAHTDMEKDKVDNSLFDELKADMGLLREEVDSMWKEIETLKKKPITRKKDEE